VVDSWPWWIRAADLPIPEPERGDWAPVVVHAPLVRELARAQPDVVLTQTAVFAQGAFAACALGLPHVWYLHELALPEHGLQPPAAAPEIGEVIAALSDRVIAISETVARHFFPQDPDSVGIVHSAPRGVRIESAERGTRPWTVGVVGTLQVGKGHADVITAVALLAKRGIDVRLRCVGAGKPADVERLQRLAADLGVADRVVLAGGTADRAAVYADLDAVVMASPNEGFSRVLFEAADAGVPLVYIDNGAAREAMVADVTGLPYAVGDIEGLAAAIESLILAADGARALASRALEHFDAWRAEPERMERLRTALSVERQAGGEALLRAMLGATAMRAADAHAAAVTAHAVAVERDALARDRDAVAAERDAMAAERDTAMRELDAMAVDRDAALAERASLAASLDAIQTSRVWRWTTPYRRLRSRAR
jgi:glycosyltransferase involved in cell wall biosynthesis